MDCAKSGRPPTTISGTVYAPNRTLALYGVTVYVPNGELPPFTEGASCSRCNGAPPPASVGSTISDESGKFTLVNAPSGVNVPLVVTVGKWRRQVTVPMVTECTDNALPPDLTALPKNHIEGDLPKIAIATGNCDALECLVRKIGVSDSEFTTDTGDGHVHLFNSNGATMLGNGTMLPPASALWSTVDKLKQYDLTMFSCECGPQPDQKPQAAMDALKAYADLGGRSFLSHYHNVWISGEHNVPTHAPAVWPTIASCGTEGTASSSNTIDTVHNPKGASFSNWMVAVMGSSSPGIIPITDGRQTCQSVDNAKAERWVYQTTGSTQFPQMFQFTTPNEVAADQRCGKVVFSDMHVASGSTSSGAFPSGCSATPMTPQEKALAFMFFDIATCVGQIN